MNRRRFQTVVCRLVQGRQQKRASLLLLTFRSPRRALQLQERFKDLQFGNHLQTPDPKQFTKNQRQQDKYRMAFLSPCLLWLPGSAPAWTTSRSQMVETLQKSCGRQCGSLTYRGLGDRPFLRTACSDTKPHPKTTH